MLLVTADAPLLAQEASEAEELASQVEVRRTTYGVPHILGENLRAAAFALGYVQVEDYGENVVRSLLSARGDMARVFGQDYLNGDFRNRQRHARAVETYDRLPQDVQDMKEGFAEGVNHYIRTYQDELPDWMEPTFTGYDVAARDIQWANPGSVRSFVERLAGNEDARVAPDIYPVPDEEGFTGHPDEGSNTWALGPDRTASGNAILMRNPHLSWEAGYYEVHFKVPGVINFYGDFRIGGPFTTIGGFNEYLGFSTTNNAPRTREIYALEVDPEQIDHYLFDGESVPIERKMISVEFKSGEGLARETREFLYTPHGPVIHRGNGWVYILSEGNHGEYRVGEQWLAKMTATSFEEWEEALRMRARPRSNLAYADRDGNIHYFWNGSVPALPHAAGGDTLAIPIRTSSEIWSELIPYEDMPAVLNPQGGYIRNENDPFHFTNLYEPLPAEDFPDFFPEPRLRLRSMHSLELLHNDRTFTLEDVVETKHSMRMLLADRVKEDLLEAVRASEASTTARVAADVLENWGNTVYADDVGAVLFETWWGLYRRAAGEGASPMEKDAGLFREPWTEDDPLNTPQGLANFEKAAEAFEKALEETEEEWGDWSVAWGDVHRIRRGDMDLPASGCHGNLGCFRLLWYEDDEDDGRRRVRGGDGWVFAVEFSEPIRAYTILAYGQSNKEDSPHHTDQLEMFARGEMKPVLFTEEDIQAHIIRSYRPGEERNGEDVANE